MRHNIPLTPKPGTRRKLAGALGLLLALGLLVTSAGTVALADALSPGPQYYGTVTIDAAAAPDGSLVEAKINGIVMISQTTVAGKYGYSAQFMVPQDDPDTEGVKDGGVEGDNVDFYVNGIYAATTPFVPGDTTEIDLAITGGEPPVFYDLTVQSIGCCDIQVEYGQVVATVDGGTSHTFNDIEEDTVVDLTVVETDTCEFVSWQVDQETPTTDDNHIAVTMDADHTAVATCQAVEPPPPAYDLTVTSDGCCDITVAYGQVYTTVYGGTSQTFFDIEEDTVVDLTAMESLTCEFVSWQVDQETPTTNDSHIMVTMDADHTAVAVCQTVEPAEIGFTMVQGWNTFSIPIALDSSMDTWDEFITHNGLAVEAAIRYDSVQKVWVTCQDTDLLMVLEGYYVLLASPAMVEILPSTDVSTPASKELVPGWNLIGLASLADRDVKYVLSTVYDVNGIGYQLVHNPPINGGGWDNYLRDGTSPPMMKVGKAYWVKMLNPGELSGFTSTPLEN